MKSAILKARPTSPNLFLALIVLVVLFAVVQQPAAPQDTGPVTDSKMTAHSSFIRYGGSVDDREAWPSPLDHEGEDLVWVLTADGFAFDLAYVYYRLSDSAMFLLPPLLGQLRADLTVARSREPGLAKDANTTAVLEQIESVLSTYDPESWILDEPEDVVSSRKTCIRAIRALFSVEGWENAPFAPACLSEETARLWVRYSELVRCLWGDERFGFPGWALRASWTRLGMPQQANRATYEHGGILPRIGDFLSFDDVNPITTWAKRRGWGERGVFRSAPSTHTAVRALVNAAERFPSGKKSLRGAVWGILRAMLNQKSPVPLPEASPVALPVKSGIARDEWSALRTQSLLATASLVRRGTLESLVFGGIRGGRRGLGKSPRLFVLYAIDPSTWRTLVTAAARARQASAMVLNMNKSLGDIHVACITGPLSLSPTGVDRWTEALKSLAADRDKMDGPILREIPLHGRIARLVGAIRFTHAYGLRSHPTNPLADPDPCQKGDHEIPDSSWLRASFHPQPLRRITFRFWLDNKPLEGIGVAPIARVKNPGGKLVELHALWNPQQARSGSTASASRPRSLRSRNARTLLSEPEA